MNLSQNRIKYQFEYSFNTNFKIYFMLLSYNPDMINKFNSYIKIYIHFRLY